MKKRGPKAAYKPNSYEVIGEKMNISPQHIWKIERDCIRKMVRGIQEKKNLPLSESVIFVADALDVEVEQLLEKLPADYIAEIKREYLSV